MTYNKMNQCRYLTNFHMKTTKLERQLIHSVTTLIETDQFMIDKQNWTAHAGLCSYLTVFQEHGS